MNLPNLSVKKPVTITMVTLIIILLGFVSLSKLSTDLFPEMNIPITVVSTSYYGASPEEIENIVTKNIEGAVATVENVKEITSVSSENNSLVMIEFNQSTNMDVAMLEIREKIDLVTSFLPDEVGTPMIIKFNPSMMPIMGFSVTYEGKDMAEITTWVEDVLSPRLERIEGVATVDLTGGTTKEVEVILDAAKLAAFKIQPTTIVSMLQAQNFNMPAGTFSDEGTDYTVRAIGEFESLEDIKELPIGGDPTVGLIKLEDIAKVQLVNEAKKTYSKVNGEDSITVTIQRQNNYNITDVAAKVNDELQQIQSEEEGASFLTIFDQAEYINMSVSSVSRNAIIGAVLAIFILIIFLKDLRPTIVIGVAIPISVITTFILVFFFGITLNVVSLGGLALGVGMLVDNAIVVLENIFRLRKEGKSRRDAAIQGTNQVAGAIIASTLTTISVFLPVVFIEGLTAQIFREMALTVTSSLLASLLIALTLVPAMSSKLLKRPDNSKHHHLMEASKRGYTRLLKGALNHRWIVLIITFIVVSGSVLGYSKIGFEFFPETDEGQISITATMPKGTSFSDTVETVKVIEGLLQDVEEIDVVSASVQGNPEGFAMFMGGGANQGNFNVVLKEVSEREKSTKEVADVIRNKLEPEVECDLTVEATTSNMGMMGSGTPIAVEITGYDLATISQIAEDVTKLVEETEGTVEVDSGIEIGAPELTVVLDRMKATPYALTTAQVAGQLKNSLNGLNATKYKVDGKELNVVVKQDQFEDLSIDQVKKTPIMSPTGGMVPLDQIAKVEQNIGYSKINRAGGSRLMTVSSQLKEGYDIRTVTSELQEKLDSYDLPDGYNINLTGMNEEIQEAFGSLGLALILGVVLIYMIMAAQFESFLYPFVIMFSVPLAFTGGFLGLYLTGSSLSVVALLGMIILAGIVVNNGIVLVDYINQIKAKGKSTKEAILEAGPIRLRPILMTALTTILALIPLALGVGEGAELEQPMAATVISGLILSTLLTLFIIPVIYSLFDSLKAVFTQQK